MPWSRYALGYHGCDAAVAKKVVAGKADLLPSANAFDWLGHGQYFWEDSLERAFRWADDEAKRAGGRIKRPAALGAVIDLGRCLNLTEGEGISLVRKAYERLREFFDEEGRLVPKNTGSGLRARRLDCAVFETVHQSRKDEALPPFDTVRAFFVEGEPLYPTAGIRQLDHVQICVRNPASIIGYFLPRNI